MKGRTNQPLIILVDGTMLTEPEIMALSEGGHQISHIVEPLTQPVDLILSRRAWRYDPKYIGLALKAARKAKKEGT